MSIILMSQIIVHADRSSIHQNKSRKIDLVHVQVSIAPAQDPLVATQKYSPTLGRILLNLKP